jgi:hypothetical protein
MRPPLGSSGHRQRSLCARPPMKELVLQSGGQPGPPSAPPLWLASAARLPTRRGVGGPPSPRWKGGGGRPGLEGGRGPRLARLSVTAGARQPQLTGDGTVTVAHPSGFASRLRDGWRCERGMGLTVRRARWPGRRCAGRPGGGPTSRAAAGSRGEGDGVSPADRESRAPSQRSSSPCSGLPAGKKVAHRGSRGRGVAHLVG